MTLGLIVAQFHHRWIVPLAGAAVGAAVFALMLPGSGVTDAAGYAAIEVIAAAAGAFAAMWLAAPPLRLENLRELGAFIVGALAQAVVGAALAATWNLVSGGQEGIRTFNVWAIAAFVGAILVAPLVMTWSGFRPKRSGGLTMPQFAAGAVGCVLFLGSLYVLFSGDTQQRFGGSVGIGLTYVPVLFMSIVALTWGARGASLPLSSAHLSTTCGIETPGGSGVPTESRSPSCRTFLSRSSTGVCRPQARKEKTTTRRRTSCSAS